MEAGGNCALSRSRPLRLVVGLKTSSVAPSKAFLTERRQVIRSGFVSDCDNVIGGVNENVTGPEWNGFSNNGPANARLAKSQVFVIITPGYGYVQNPRL